MMQTDWAREALERELYWLGEEGAGEPFQAAEELRLALRRLERRLRADIPRKVPKDEPFTKEAAWKRRIKGFIQRLTRPVSRRYDRITAELAGMGASLAEGLARAQTDIRSLESEVRALSKAVQPPSPSLDPSAEADDALAAERMDVYYWLFESRMRGSSESLEERLTQYEGLARDLRTRSGDEQPLWIDLGCGRGELLGLARGWGYKVHGVDVSQEALDECAARGVDTTKADLMHFLRGYAGEGPLVVSAVQVIEHLPKGEWVALFERAVRVLRPGGAFLVETINPLNTRSLSETFFADISHTWPAHPETLKLMALHAGFRHAEIRYLNEDGTGVAQDFAVWAQTDDADRGL
jgi:O-antigen chain-terminating methyltransferase